ncbi:MAG: glycosyltransferase family 47 protein [Phormidium tanganyikae FI6-MK23]|jgi:hypothetical protein|nr:glycosyltransferase family 47 protein [Phormidium tanganyikae FI6-MK23]
MPSSPNKFYIWNLRLESDAQPIAWNPPESNEAFQGGDCGEYFGKVFEAMQQKLEIENLVFYFTRDIDRLPSYGENVVAVVIGDEWSRIPKYFHKVRAVFKCYGINSSSGFNLLQPSYLNLLTFTQFIGNQIVNSSRWINHSFYRLRRRKTSPIYDIPLGYSNLVELPVKPILERGTDVFFAGSVVHRPRSKWSLKYWIKTPKSLSRSQMLANIDRIKKTQPEISVELSVTEGFVVSYDPTKSADAKSYSEKMMNTKVCLVPRGTSFETFRFFEAMRCGCLIITESLPPRWFYDGSPAIQVRDWREMKVVLELLSDRELLESKHQAALRWWQEKCSETAVGEYIAEKLQQTR